MVEQQGRFGNGDPRNDVDAESTMANLEFAVRTWAAGAEKLLVYCVDHGAEDLGEGLFRVNFGEDQILRAGTLDGWLDGLQLLTPGRQRQKVVVDFCYAGAFLPWITPPAGEERLVVASSGPEKLTFFVADGMISFSDAFWNTVFTGSTFGQAFVTARDSMAPLGQQAQADDNGDGLYDPGVDVGEDSTGWIRHIGFSYMAGAARPRIGKVVPYLVLPVNEYSAALWAADISGTYPVEEVWAIVVPPDFQTNPDTSDPVLDLPEVELRYSRSQKRWEG